MESKKRINREEANKKLETLIERLNSSAKEYGMDYTTKPYADKVGRYIREVLKEEIKAHYIISDGW